jgi:predicted regulator of Ras-like GTPase activity (Roadblock/LC7/MglB family)
LPFQTLLDELVSKLECVNAAIVLEADGEAVQWHAPDDGERLRLKGAYIAVIMQSLRASAAKLGLGGFNCFVLEYDGATLVIEELDNSYFVMLELGPTANISEAIYRIQPTVAGLRRALAA